MYPHQAERLTAVLEREKLDALVGTTPENVAYVTGFRSMNQATYRTTQYAVFTRGGTALVVPAVDLAAIVGARVDVTHVTCFGGFVSNFHERLGPDEERIHSLAESRRPTPAAALAAALDALGVSSGTVGLDEGYLSHPAWQRITAGLGPITAVPGANHLLSARRIKSPYEIACLERALWLAEEAINTVIQTLERGVTEREAATAYEGDVVKRGGSPYGVIIAMGEHSSVPVPYPADRALRAGDLVRLDVGCVWKGYHSEVARTAVMGEPNARQRAAYEAIQTGLEAAIEAVKPGIPAGRVWETAVGATRGAGLPEYQRYHVGHGIGLEPYERPKLFNGNATLLEAPEVLRIETPYIEHGWAGPNVKETVLVTQAGGRVLNRSRRGLVVLD